MQYARKERGVAVAEPSEVAGRSADARNGASGRASGSEEYTTVEVQGLRIGSQLRLPINDEHSTLLLAEGQTITPSFMEILRRRGLETVRVHASELPRIYAGKPQGELREVPQPNSAPPALAETNDLLDEFDDALLDPANVALPPQETAFSEAVVKRDAASYDAKEMAACVERQNAAVKQVDGVFARLLRGDGLDVDGLASIADSAMADLQNDMDLFSCLGVNPFGSDFPARHSMHACMLSISLGTHLGFDRPTLKELAIGCLVHDVGMLMIDHRSFAEPRRLEQVEFLEITKHPVRIFDKMLEMRGIPTRSAYVAYQMHERPDGSGYPRRRKAGLIHVLSRTAAVADVYVALVAPRPHRAGILPHTALQAILKAGRAGQLDPAASTALLRTLSAYPLGSYVQLSDGRVGTVIRANGDDYERPVVEAWRRERLGTVPDVLDLHVLRDLSIEGPLTALDAPFERGRDELDGLRALIAGCTSGASGATAASATPDASSQRAHPRRSFQVKVTVYYPRSASATGSAVSWIRAEGLSRDFSIGGMSMLASKEIRGRNLLVAFDLTPGLRACFVTEVVRRRQVDATCWEYGFRFSGRTEEPSIPGDLQNL